MSSHKGGRTRKDKRNGQQGTKKSRPLYDRRSARRQIHHQYVPGTWVRDSADPYSQSCERSQRVSQMSQDQLSHPDMKENQAKVHQVNTFTGRYVLAEKDNATVRPMPSPMSDTESQFPSVANYQFLGVAPRMSLGPSWYDSQGGSEVDPNRGHSLESGVTAWGQCPPAYQTATNQNSLYRYGAAPPPGPGGSFSREEKTSTVLVYDVRSDIRQGPGQMASPVTAAAHKRDLDRSHARPLPPSTQGMSLTSGISSMASLGIVPFRPRQILEPTVRDRNVRLNVRRWNDFCKEPVTSSVISPPSPEELRQGGLSKSHESVMKYDELAQKPRKRGVGTDYYRVQSKYMQFLNGESGKFEQRRDLPGALTITFQRNREQEWIKVRLFANDGSSRPMLEGKVLQRMQYEFHPGYRTAPDYAQMRERLSGYQLGNAVKVKKGWMRVIRKVYRDKGVRNEEEEEKDDEEEEKEREFDLVGETVQWDQETAFREVSRHSGQHWSPRLAHILRERILPVSDFSVDFFLSVENNGPNAFKYRPEQDPKEASVGFRFTLVGYQNCKGFMDFWNAVMLPYKARHDFLGFSSHSFFRRIYLPVSEKTLMGEVFSSHVESDLLNTLKKYVPTARDRANKFKLLYELDAVAKEAFISDSDSDHQINQDWGGSNTPETQFADIIGSMGANLDSKTADVDCCLVIHGPKYNGNAKSSQSEEAAHLKIFENKLKGIARSKGQTLVQLPLATSMDSFIKSDYSKSFDWVIKPIYCAKVPILRIFQRGVGVSADVSISITSHEARHLKAMACISYLHELMQYSLHSTCFPALSFTKGLKIKTHVFRIKDNRVLPFIMAIKMWARKRKLNQAFKRFLNSYGWVVLCIKYLQIIEPPILPILPIRPRDFRVDRRRHHRGESTGVEPRHPHKFASELVIRDDILAAIGPETNPREVNLAVLEELKKKRDQDKKENQEGWVWGCEGEGESGLDEDDCPIPVTPENLKKLISQAFEQGFAHGLDERDKQKKEDKDPYHTNVANKMSLISLLYGFFEFMWNFDPKTCSVSIGTEGLTRKHADSRFASDVLVIEDPLDMENNLASSVSPMNWHLMRLEFARALRILSQGKHKRNVWDLVCADRIVGNKKVIPENPLKSANKWHKAKKQEEEEEEKEEKGKGKGKGKRKRKRKGTSGDLSFGSPEYWHWPNGSRERASQYAQGRANPHLSPAAYGGMAQTLNVRQNPFISSRSPHYSVAIIPSQNDANSSGYVQEDVLHSRFNHGNRY